MPVGSGAWTLGANAGARTSSQAIGPVPTVTDVSQGKDAPAVAASVPQTVIADRRAEATAT